MVLPHGLHNNYPTKEIREGGDMHFGATGAELKAHTNEGRMASHAFVC